MAKPTGNRPGLALPSAPSSEDLNSIQMSRLVLLLIIASLIIVLTGATDDGMCTSPPVDGDSGAPSCGASDAASDGHEFGGPGPTLRFIKAIDAAKSAHLLI